MKKTLLFIVMISILSLTACGNKTSFEFDFDGFYGYFFTKNTFISGESEKEGLGYQLLKEDIIKIYTKTNSTGYIDSIIILKKQTNKDLKDFISDNLEKIKIDGYSQKNEKNTTIKCKEEKLQMYTANSEIDGNLNSIFLSHSFVKKDDYIYIISFSTQERDERDIFSSDIRKIKCK